MYFRLEFKITLVYGDDPGSDFENPITLKKQISKRGFLMKSFINSIMI